ncbi:MAG: hypothetical protein QOI98_2385 [Solirubrobacteraceae bacterium]|nr:hypothetical protein [Solirubrobacteraceae bacterium]
MSTGLDAMVDSLLYEGYALYPYTPGATKNATPTPFGIVYPPAYAGGSDWTFHHLELQCLLEGGETLTGEVRFLQPDGPRHQAAARRLELGESPVADLSGDGVSADQSFPSDEGDTLEVHIDLRAERQPDGRVLATLRVENRTPAADGLDRAGALRHSLISTHPILHVRGGRFVSPLESGGACDNVNTWPVLATAEDDVMLGAAIVLPDHPQIAPESRGNLFDSTEIEEALLLHVHVLSDDERAAIEEQDPAVREMVARAAAATPEDMLALHGRVTLRDPVTTEPPQPSAAVRDPSRGEEEATADGKTFRRGGKVVLRPGPDADLHARLVEGRTATVERIFTDWDGKVHLAVTIDDDPGQDLLRETNRFLFFFAHEVEVA